MSSYLQWVEGDLVITDNMAMAHRATREAFKKPEEIGDRVLHRTSTLTSRIPKPVRGFGSNEGKQTKNCVEDDQGLCIIIENDNKNAASDAIHTDSIKKDEL